MTWEEIGFFGFQGFYLAPGQVGLSAAVFADTVIGIARPTGVSSFDNLRMIALFHIR